MDQSTEALFEYLKNILYYPEKASLDVDVLPPEYQKLGQGLVFLDKNIRENRAFENAMAKGNLSFEPPGPENVLAGSLKELQGALRHLTWQAKQIAKGDYSHSVDFMGEFSASFNVMTKQLKERTAQLEEQNSELRKLSELFIKMTDHVHQMIFVYDETGKEVFCNAAAKWYENSQKNNYEEIQKILFSHSITPDVDIDYWEFEFEDKGYSKIFYEVESFEMNWQGTLATVHVISDETERKNKENLMYQFAYRDALTNAYNRRYAMDTMESLKKEQIPFTIAYVDLDYLKIYNDLYGHDTGDQYLADIVDCLHQLGGKVCRFGGDEFVVIKRHGNAEEEEKKLECLRNEFIESETYKDLKKSFSYAVCLVPKESKDPIDFYLSRVDKDMYDYKRNNKEIINIRKD